MKDEYVFYLSSIFGAAFIQRSHSSSITSTINARMTLLHIKLWKMIANKIWIKQQINLFRQQNTKIFRRIEKWRGCTYLVCTTN